MRTSSIVAGLAVAMAVAMVATSRPRAAATAAIVKEQSDSYALPPTEILPQVSMGYRAALADLLWAHVLVTQGLRMRERRPFDYVVQYIDAINTLDPKFRDPYRLSDTLTAFQTNDPNKEKNVREARRIMERGLREFPFDSELWLDHGRFLAYVAPSVLKDPTEREQWRADGANALVRVAELGGSDPTDIHKSFAAVTFLSKRGETEAAIHMLEKAYAITEDPDARAQIEMRLRLLLGTRAESERMMLTRAFDDLWRADLPFVARGQMSVLGPPVNVWRCAGRRESAPVARTECARDWLEWSRTVTRQHADL